MKKFAFACVVALLVPATAFAILPFDPWLGVSGSITTYDMGDVNSQISDIDLTNLDEIGSGFSFGAHAGLSVTPMITATAGYEFLTGGSELSGASEQFDWNLPAHTFRGGLELRAPVPGPLKVGAGATLGVVSAAGDVLRENIPNFADLVGEVSGTGTLFEGYAVADLWFTPIMALSPSIGYRFAKIPEIKVNDVTVTNLDGSDLSLDYSGYYMRLTFKLGLP